jgi:ferric-dicitrate binding protein FerR (iron transport regulator)
MHDSRLVRSRLVSLVVLTILTIMLLAPAAHAQSTVGSISQIQGVANIQRGAANIVAAMNTPIEVHDKIVTQPGASLTIGLVDNSSLQMGPSSTLTIDESVAVGGAGAPSKVGLLGGSLHSTIVGAMRGNSPAFEVDTPNASAVVHGTEWNTTYSDQNQDGYPDCKEFTWVDVQDGNVDVTICPHTGGASEIVPAGGHKFVACCAAVPWGYDDALLFGGLGALLIGGITVGTLCGTDTICGGHHHHSASE